VSLANKLLHHKTVDKKSYELFGELLLVLMSDFDKYGLFLHNGQKYFFTYISTQG